jgi:hypothetical protein
MPATLPLRHFVWTRVFERTAAALLGEAELLALEARLRLNPFAGSTEDQAGGVRKIRVGRPGRGKSAGARVIYYYAGPRDTVYWLLAFGKNVQPSLTAEQKKMLRQMVRRLERP